MNPKPMVAFDVFAALDIRAGRVTACRPNDAARVPAHIVEVDFGELGQRTTSAQITNYDCEALVGRIVIGVLNIGSRRIAGVRSDFLLLGAYDADGRVALLTPDQPRQPGSSIG